MRARILTIIGCALTSILAASGSGQHSSAARSPVDVSWVTVKIQGTSKGGPFLASSRAVRVDRVQLAEPRSADVFAQVLRKDGFEAFDVSLPVMTLTSRDKGVAGYIHDSLRADTHPEIRFQLRSTTEASTDAKGGGRLNAKGMLTVAGVEREVRFDVHVRKGAHSALFVDGSTDLLMTDFGVTPPVGPLGKLKTDPRIHVRFYLIVSAEDE